MTKVAFAGGKPPGIAAFEKLLHTKGAEIVAVFPNAEDRQATHWYNGKTMTEIALLAGAPVYMVPAIDAATLAATGAELLVVVYYDAILPADVLAVPRLGCVNLHLGLAEEYRGAYPQTWAIIDGKTKAGVTLHYMDPGIDSGPIIAQRRVLILPDDNGRNLYFRLANIGAELLAECLPALLAGPVLSRPQVTTPQTQRHYKRDFPSHEIALPDETKNMIRALTFPPFRPPYVSIGGKHYLIVPEDAQAYRHNW